MQVPAIINTLIATAERLEAEAGRLRKEAIRLELTTGPVSTRPSISARTKVIAKRIESIKRPNVETPGL